MRRLSLLLLLLACALPVLAAEQPFVITKDLQIVPDSANLVRIEALPIALDTMKGRYWHNFALPFCSFPLLGVSKTNCASSNAPGVAKAEVRLDTLSSAHLLNPASGSLPTVGLFERRAWAEVGARFRLHNTRIVKRVVFKGHIRGAAYSACHQWIAPEASRRNPGSTGGSINVWFGLSAVSGYAPSALDLKIHPDSGFPDITGLDDYAANMVLDRRLGTIAEAFEWSGCRVQSTLDCAVKAELTPTAPAVVDLSDANTTGNFASDYWKLLASHQLNELSYWDPGSRISGLLTQGLDHGGIVTVSLILDVGFVGNGLSSFSTSWLDFYSRDFGAYFDSLEIELEPVKKSAKS